MDNHRHFIGQSDDLRPVQSLMGFHGTNRIYQSSDNSRRQFNVQSEQKSYGNSGDRPYDHHAYDNSDDKSYGSERFRPYGNSEHQSFGNSRFQPFEHSEYRPKSYGNSEHQSYGSPRNQPLGGSDYKSYRNSEHQSYGNSRYEAFRNSERKAYENPRYQSIENSEHLPSIHSLVKRPDENLSSLQPRQNPYETQTSLSHFPRSDQLDSSNMRRVNDKFPQSDELDFSSMRRDRPTCNNKSQINSRYDEEEYPLKMSRYEPKYKSISNTQSSQNSADTWRPERDQPSREFKDRFHQPSDQIQVNSQFGDISRPSENRTNPIQYKNSHEKFSSNPAVDNNVNILFFNEPEPQANPRFSHEDPERHPKTTSCPDNSASQLGTNQAELKISEKDKYTPEQLLQIYDTGSVLSDQAMIDLFKELVICYFFTEQGEPLNKKDILNVVSESFKRSNIPELDFQFGTCKTKSEEGEFCLVLWEDKLIAKATSFAKNKIRRKILEELIKKLHRCCYCIKAKFEYFSRGGFLNKMCDMAKAGVFRIVTRKDAPSAEAALKYIDYFFNQDTDCELIFPQQKGFTHTDFLEIIKHVTAKGLDHICDEDHYISVFTRRTPQYWRDKILASGKTHNDKFILQAPTSPFFSKIPTKSMGQSAVPRESPLASAEKSGTQQNKTRLNPFLINHITAAVATPVSLHEGPGPTAEEKEQCVQRIGEIMAKFAGKKNCRKKTRGQRFKKAIVAEKVQMGIPLAEIPELKALGKRGMRRASHLQAAWKKEYASRK